MVYLLVFGNVTIAPSVLFLMLADVCLQLCDFILKSYHFLQILVILKQLKESQPMIL